jgi:hypothetical protein
MESAVKLKQQRVIIQAGEFEVTGNATRNEKTVKCLG